MGAPLALDGGADGLDLIRRLLLTAPACLAPGGMILLEIEASQGTAAQALARQAFPEVHASACTPTCLRTTACWKSKPEFIRRIRLFAPFVVILNLTAQKYSLREISSILIYYLDYYDSIYFIILADAGITDHTNKGVPSCTVLPCSSSSWPSPYPPAPPNRLPPACPPSRPGWTSPIRRRSTASPLRRQTPTPHKRSNPLVNSPHGFRGHLLHRAAGIAGQLRSG